MFSLPLAVAIARIHIDRADEEDRRAEARRDAGAESSPGRCGPVEPRRPLIVELANRYRLHACPDLVEMCSRVDVQVVHRPMRDDLAGYVHPLVPMFAVNSDTTPQRQRFTLAQLIGHWIWHRKAILDHEGLNVGMDGRGVPDAPYHNPGIDVRDETFAMKCAIDLIMSEPVVRRLHQEGLDVDGIATRLGTTRRAIGIRFESLGLESRA